MSTTAIKWKVALNALKFQGLAMKLRGMAKRIRQQGVQSPSRSLFVTLPVTVIKRSDQNSLLEKRLTVQRFTAGRNLKVSESGEFWCSPHFLHFLQCRIPALGMALPTVVVVGSFDFI